MQIEYNDQFQAALTSLESGTKPLFITGKAGTGKSTLLKLFLEKTEKNCVVLAPTGVAALNVKGSTIHSFFGFRPGITVEKAREKGKNVKKNSLIHSLHTIVIDEISMVRSDLLDCIDAFLQAANNKKLPFGGIRMVFIGDLFQLPPVLRSEEKEVFEQVYESPYFFSSKAMKETTFEVIELEKIYRQNDLAFIEVLNAIRKNRVSPDQLDFINQRVIPSAEKNPSIYLTAINQAADAINEEKLQTISSPLHSFPAVVEGEFENSYAPTDGDLKMKVGAQVMLLTNNPEGLWVNGTIGRVIEIKEKEILVQKEEGGRVTVEPFKWTLYKYRLDEAKKLIHDEVGSFTQYPLCLAWAITIHKSQGKTFDRAVVDLSRSFAPGQTYVALSRLRTFDGLFLKVPVKKEQIKMSHHVTQFFNQWHDWT